MTETKKQDKIKMLCWMDSPAVSTGFASVARGILNELAKTNKYDIDVIGINDRGGWKDPEKYPYRIYPARSANEVNGDFHGRPRLLASILGKDPELKAPWDIVFTLNDPFILEQPLAGFGMGTIAFLKQTQEVFKKKAPVQYRFKIVSYWPIDSEIKENWVQNSIALADYSVAYSEYGRKEILRADKKLGEKKTHVDNRMSVIYHGVNLEDFHPISEEERQEFRKVFFDGVVQPHTFVVGVVARNQQRKDLPRTLKIFKEFQKRRPDSFLYIHAAENDAWGSLQEYARPLNLELGKDWGVPAGFNPNFGFDIKDVNKIYNAADCILSTSLGEGWGFYNTEAMATKTVVVAPNNTVHPELFGYEPTDDIEDIEELLKSGIRGIPVKSGSNLTEFVTQGPSDMERYRPIVNVEDAVAKLTWVYDNPEKVAQITENAYKWVQNITWKNIAGQWDELLTKVYNTLQYERANSIVETSKKNQK